MFFALFSAIILPFSYTSLIISHLQTKNFFKNFNNDNFSFYIIHRYRGVRGIREFREFREFWQLATDRKRKSSLSDYPYITILRHLIEQLLARLFEHIDNEVESLPTLIVWVGNIVVAVGIGRKVVTHTIYLIYILSCWRKATNSLVVAVVHHDNSVEIVEIGNTKWA